MKQSTSTLWKEAWQQKQFNIKLLAGFAVLIGILSLYPLFFQHIENREGIILNDWLLKKMKPQDLSLFVFIPIWLITALTIFRCITNPQLLLLFYGHLLTKKMKLILKEEWKLKCSVTNFGTLIILERNSVHSKITCKFLQ